MVIIREMNFILTPETTVSQHDGMGLATSQPVYRDKKLIKMKEN